MTPEDEEFEALERRLKPKTTQPSQGWRKRQIEAFKLALDALEEPKEHIAKHKRLEAVVTIRQILKEKETNQQED